MSEPLGLSEVVKALRRELADAVAQGEGEDIRFHLGDIEIELQTTVERSAQGNTGVKFWVLDARAGGEARREDVHTLRLALKAIDESGRDDTAASGPIKLGR